MKVTWRNDALCLKPETEVERQSLAAIALGNKAKDDPLIPGFTGEESNSQLSRIEH